MDKRYWLIGVSIFSALCLALVILFVLLQEEPGFLEDAPQWERADFPLPVCVESYRSDGAITATGDDSKAVEEAVGRANSRLADHLFAERWTFVMSCNRDVPHINVVVGIPAEPGWMDPGGHSAIANSAGRAEMCNVATSNTGGAGDLTVQVIYHELGHCLGLAHDEQMNSSNNVMQPTTEKTESGIPDWFSDYDREIIRERYMP